MTTTKQSLIHFPGLAGLLLLASIAAHVCSCKQQPDLTEYNSVKDSYRELALQIRLAIRDWKQPIASFRELCEAIRSSFPETQVAIEHKNPFPGLLPDRKYSRASAWPLVSTNAMTPLLWTEVPVHERCVLYITTHGEIDVLHLTEFNNLLKTCLANGLKVDEER